MARIGMVSIWFHRGQTEVTQTIRRALEDNGHEVFIFARMGQVYGQEKCESTDPYFAVQNLTIWPKYQIPVNVLELWSRKNKLDAVVFNEEYDFSLPAILEISGIKTIHYVDFLHSDWKEPLKKYYHLLWSATYRTLKQLEDLGLYEKSFCMGWGIHAKHQPYHGAIEPDYDFFTNQGWLGINLRKGCDFFLKAFDLLNEQKRYTALVHAQVPPSMLPDDLQAIVHKYQAAGNLQWLMATVPPPGLYHRGKVVVQPSRLEGLGLTIPEAMWQGRAVITTDAPPMSEFIIQPELRAKVTSIHQRSDGLIFPECEVDISSLADAMRLAASVGVLWKGYGTFNRKRALSVFDWGKFCQQVQHSLDRLGLQSC